METVKGFIYFFKNCRHCDERCNHQGVSKTFYEMLWIHGRINIYLALFLSFQLITKPTAVLHCRLVQLKRKNKAMKLGHYTINEGLICHC